MIEAAGQAGVAPVLLACMPGEQHGLPLRALGAALASRRVPLIALGGDTPAPALAAAITAREPAAVFLGAQMDRNADPHLFEQLPPSRYVLGGPAWRKESLEADVQVVHSLTEAADVLAALLSATCRISMLRRAHGRLVPLFDQRGRAVGPGDRLPDSSLDDGFLRDLRLWMVSGHRM